MQTAKIQQVIEELAKAKNENAFNAMCLSLAKVIQADYVFIATLNKAQTQATTLSLVSEGCVIKNFTYELAETPCEEVCHGHVCNHKEQIQQAYPHDQLLIDMGIEGYVGIPLKNEHNQVDGILVALYKQPIVDASDTQTLFLLFSGLIQKELEKQSSQAQLELTNKVIQESHEAIMICNHNAEIIYVNNAFCHISGYSPEDITGKNPSILNSGKHGKHYYKAMWQAVLTEGHWAGEIWNKRKNGEIYPERLVINAIFDKQQKITHFVCFFADMSESKRTQEKLFQQTNFDSLTQLANRNLFIDHLNQAIKHAQYNQTRFSLFILDLDLFKNINESYGIQLGDKLILLVAQRLKSLLSATDIAARIGGDSFALLVHSQALQSEAERFADKMMQAFLTPFQIKDVSIHCTFSLGIALFPLDSKTPYDLMKNATQALHDAKQSGRNTFSFFTQRMQDDALRRIELKNELEQALTNQSLTMVYQPIVNIETGNIEKFEALVRWHHHGQFVSPAEFIPLAEEFGLITQVGDLVMKQACLALKKLKEQNIHTKFNINRSIYEFPRQQRHQAKWLNQIIEYGLTPDDICIELTESALAADNTNIHSILAQLQLAGCEIALDDFGTGYSSLSYLRKFPIDIIKIDRAFINDMTNNHDDRVLVETILAMTNALGKKAVAEGAETLEQVQILQALGCQWIQGYYFSKPLAESELVGFIQQFKLNI